MKKEKKVRTYQRRTKSGKTVTVRAHTASYEAAEKAKEAAKKKGAGDEIVERKKKNWELPMDEFLKKLKEERAQKREDEEAKKVEDEKPKKESEKKTEKKTPAKKTTKKRTVGTGTNGPEPKKKTTTKKTDAKSDTSEPAFTRDEFKEWYRGTGSAADKKVAKALRKQLGSSGYRKFEDEAINNYTSRGHLSMFKRVSGGSSTSVKTKSADATKVTKDKVSTPKISTSTKLSAKDISDIELPRRDIRKIAKEFGVSDRAVGAWYAGGNWGGATSSDFKESGKLDKAIKKTLGKKAYDAASSDAKLVDAVLDKKVRSKYVKTSKTTKSKGSTSTNSDEGSLKIPDGVKEPRGLRKAAPKSKVSKRSVGTGTNGHEPKKSSATATKTSDTLKKGYFASKADAVKAMKEKGYVVNSKGDVRTQFKNDIATTKGRIMKVGDTWTLRHPAR